MPLYERLLLEAKELGHLARNYDLSVVVAETALEVLVQQEIAATCERRGMAQLPLGAGKGEKLVPFREAIENGRFRDDLLGRYPLMLSGINLKQISEYKIWYHKAYVPRNAIVHTGARVMDESAAIDAFDAVVAFGERIRMSLS